MLPIHPTLPIGYHAWVSTLAYTPIRELREKFNSGELNPQQLMQDCLRQHQRWHTDLSAYHLWDERQIKAEFAANKDRSGAGGRNTDSLLWNIPFSVKSVVAVENYPVFAGTARALPEGFVTQGEVVSRLKQQGGVVSGITHAAEFAVGGLGVNEHWPTPRNPWDVNQHRVPGGSSSGAAVSVWEGSCVFAIGTDTGGSVRVPASASGLAGLKTTAGRWPLSGVVPLAHRFDSLGVVAHRVSDLVEVFNAVDSGTTVSAQDAAAAGFDSYCVRLASDVCWQDLDPGIAESIEAAIAELCRAGMQLQGTPSNVQQLATDLRSDNKPNSAAIECGAMLHGELLDYLPTLSGHVRRFIDSESDRTDAEHQARIDEVARYQSQIKAQQAHNEITLCPTLRQTPPTLSQISNVETYAHYSDSLLHNTVLPSMARQCAVTVPVGLDSMGMPVGLQIIAPSGCDASLLRFALLVENELGCALSRLGLPPLLATA